MGWGECTYSFGVGEGKGRATRSGGGGAEDFRSYPKVTCASQLTSGWREGLMKSLFKKVLTQCRRTITPYTTSVDLANWQHCVHPALFKYTTQACSPFVLVWKTFTPTKF